MFFIIQLYNNSLKLINVNYLTNLTFYFYIKSKPIQKFILILLLKLHLLLFIYLLHLLCHQNLLGVAMYFLHLCSYLIHSIIRQDKVFILMKAFRKVLSVNDKSSFKILFDLIPALLSLLFLVTLIIIEKLFVSYFYWGRRGNPERMCWYFFFF